MQTTSPNNAPNGRLRDAIDHVRAMDLAAEAAVQREASVRVAEIVRTLGADEDVVIAALLQSLLSGRLVDASAAERTFGMEPIRLARELGALGHFGLPIDWTEERGLEPAQAEALRKMLLAVIGDVRLVVVRLAEQVEKMRSAKHQSTALQRKLALETREVYAPLANRMGVWQLKWELEDLAFRYLEPAPYKRIAASLKERRSQRERYIEELKLTLERELLAAGIDARVDGRPKHIFSIWRKMQAKQLEFEQLMDIRAARILVNGVAECYAALGVVHSLWRFIPGEFDDYIATPKDNLYRSIHTAVVGPRGVPVEIQIRTHEMHTNSELGVAAHWRYKEGGRGDQAYERKIGQLRALLAPGEADGRSQDFLERMRIDLFRDRVYVLSPRGDIVEVPTSGTPLDFAYQVHTDLGHRTRGAKVNGRIVPLDYPLKNGERVEIIAAKKAQPSRDWLSSRSGFLASARHRNKVKAWFRRQAAADERTDGRTEGKTVPERLSERRASQPDVGKSSLSDSRRIAQVHQPETEVQGIGDLLSSYARCCKPVPPEPIVGYITVGRGVSIHGRSCANLARLRAKSPARVLEVMWGESGTEDVPVDIEVEAFDRRGLMRDVSAVISDEKVSIRGINSLTDKRDNVAHLRMSVAVSGLPQLSKLLARIAQVPNVLSARRRR